LWKELFWVFFFPLGGKKKSIRKLPQYLVPPLFREGKYYQELQRVDPPPPFVEERKGGSHVSHWGRAECKEGFPPKHPGVVSLLSPPRGGREGFRV